MGGEQFADLVRRADKVFRKAMPPMGITVGVDWADIKHGNAIAFKFAFAADRFNKITRQVVLSESFAAKTFPKSIASVEDWAINYVRAVAGDMAAELAKQSEPPKSYLDDYLGGGTPVPTMAEVQVLDHYDGEQTTIMMPRKLGMGSLMMHPLVTNYIRAENAKTLGEDAARILDGRNAKSSADVPPTADEDDCQPFIVGG